MTHKYGFSARHDAALDLCIAMKKICPTGCVKDGAPNCYAHVVGIQGIEQCDPGKLTSNIQYEKISENEEKQKQLF